MSCNCGKPSMNGGIVIPDPFSGLVCPGSCPECAGKQIVEGIRKKDDGSDPNLAWTARDIQKALNESRQTDNRPGMTSLRQVPSVEA